jgi:hypothetical protein
MKRVAQYTDKLYAQCFIQDTDRLREVELIVFGHRTIDDLLTRSGPDFFYVFQETYRCCLQSTYTVNNVRHLPRLCVERAVSIP